MFRDFKLNGWSLNLFHAPKITRALRMLAVLIEYSPWDANEVWLERDKV